jgi:hypothetical protein
VRASRVSGTIWRVLIARATLDAIAAGDVTLAFRRWARPRVKVGTRMRTAVGLVEVTSLQRVDPGALTEADARAAGARSLEALRDAQPKRAAAGEPLWRIGLRWAGEDPRGALRDDTEGLEAVAERLRRIDARSTHGPWTRSVLELIARRPETLAADLAAEMGRERLAFKADVRRLKELGLTESLPVGYRLSARGRALLGSDLLER